MDQAKTKIIKDLVKVQIEKYTDPRPSIVAMCYCFVFSNYKNQTAMFLQEFLLLAVLNSSVVVKVKTPTRFGLFRHLATYSHVLWLASSV